MRLGQRSQAHTVNHCSDQKTVSHDCPVLSIKREKTHLSIICLARGEQGIERVVARNQETGKVDEELASNVEENQEGVDSDQAEDDIDLRNGGLALQIVEDRVLREL